MGRSGPRTGHSLHRAVSPRLQSTTAISRSRARGRDAQVSPALRLQHGSTGRYPQGRMSSRSPVASQVPQVPALPRRSRDARLLASDGAAGRDGQAAVRPRAGQSWCWAGAQRRRAGCDVRSEGVRHLRSWVRRRWRSSGCRGWERDCWAPGGPRRRPRSSLSGRGKDVKGGKQRPPARSGDFRRPPSPPALPLATGDAPSTSADGAAGPAAARWPEQTLQRRWAAFRPPADPVTSLGCKSTSSPRLFSVPLLQCFNPSASQHRNANKRPEGGH